MNFINFIKSFERKDNKFLIESILKGYNILFENNVLDNPNFKSWFGNSKIIDKNGNPLIVYHGTNKDIKKFTTKRIGIGSTLFGDYEIERYGIFATPDPKLAEEFASQGNKKFKGENILPLYMKIENPIDFYNGKYTDEMFENVIKQAEKQGLKGYSTARLLGDKWATNQIWTLFDKDEYNDPEDWIKLFKNMGFDGALLSEPKTEKTGLSGMTIVAFEPNQVKSAIGNVGEFSETLTNITESIDKNMNFTKSLDSTNWIYHNTKSEFLNDIKKEGLTAGSFSTKPIDFGGDIWLAVNKNILPSNTQEHQYANVTAIEPGWDNFVIFPNQLYFANKKGKIIGKLIENKLNEAMENSQKYNKFPLSALVKQAKKFDDFKDFKKFYIVDIFHGYYWHLTDNPKFVISKETGPRDMSSMASGRISEKGALMITSHFEYWNEYYNGEKITRPYAVLLDASDIEPRYLKQVFRGFGNEVYIYPTQAEQLKILGIYNINYAKKLDKKFSNLVPQSEEELMELWKYARN